MQGWNTGLFIVLNKHSLCYLPYLYITVGLFYLYIGLFVLACVALQLHRQSAGGELLFSLCPFPRPCKTTTKVEKEFKVVLVQ